MAQKVQVQLVDDMDGSAAAHTIEFGYRGQGYSIDLSEGNASVLAGFLAPYITAARRVGKAPRGTGDKPTRTGPHAQDVRDWASKNGIVVSPRGRVPAEIIEQYLVAV